MKIAGRFVVGERRCTRATRRFFVCVLTCVVAISISGCGAPSLRQVMTRRGHVSSAKVEMRRIAVVSADTPPEFAAHGWQPTLRQSTWGGALAGAAAGAGVGAGVCAPSLIFPPFYAACVAVWGLGGSGVGAISGHVAHAQLASDPANMMLPPGRELSKEFRDRMLSRLAADQSVTARDGGTARLEFALPKASGAAAMPMVADVVPPSAEGAEPTGPEWTLEIALTRIGAVAKRKGGFVVEMTARARLRAPLAGKAPRVEKFEYSSDRIETKGGSEADAARIVAEVTRGLDAIAKDIHDSLVTDR